MSEATLSKKSDLKVRILSAIVMVTVAGGALWAGGALFTLFAGLIALGVIWEYWGLVHKIASGALGRLIWMIFGIGYVGIAVWQLIAIRNAEDGDPYFALTVISAVIAVDVGAYFAGRLIGGPKIAPKISPSKTWAGLFGGMIGAAIVANIYMMVIFGLGSNPFTYDLWSKALPAGLAIAVVAQAGDFFESWMKRRAGVKDSGNLIPGHGGLFDRVDGLLAVLFVLSMLFWLSR